MQCKILRPFDYSINGRDALQAVEGATVEIPDDLVAGLKAEGYVETDGTITGGSISADLIQTDGTITGKAAPENKMADTSDIETGAITDLSDASQADDAGKDDEELAAARIEYAQTFSKAAPVHWKAETIRTKIADA